MGTEEPDDGRQAIAITAPPLPEVKYINSTSGAELVARSLDNTNQTESSSYIFDSQTVTAIQKVFNGQDTTLQTQIAELLGNAVREEKWRNPIGESGVLEEVLNLQSKNLQVFELDKQILRILVNSCADTDANRKIIVENDGLKTVFSIIKQDNELSSLALIQLYNLCLDYESAQSKAVEEGFCQLLVDHLGKHQDDAEELSSTDLYHCAKVLELLLLQEAGRKSCSEGAIKVILITIKSLDIEFEEYYSLLKSALQLLNLPQVQLDMIASLHVDSLLDVFEDTYKRLPSFIESCDGDAELEKENIDTVQRIRYLINEALSNISSDDHFSDTYLLSSPLVRKLETWLHSQHTDLCICAAIMLGNIARSEEVCRKLVLEHNVQMPLVNTLKNYSTVGVLHAAVGMLKNLSISGVDIREKIGGLGAIDACDKFLRQNSIGQIQYIGLSLIRVLINGSLTNTKQLLFTTTDTGDKKNVLFNIVNLFTDPTELPVKTEISRIIASCLRTAYSSPKEDLKFDNILSTSIADNFTGKIIHSHPHIAKPLVFMVTQDKWPSVRSEGLFALALMARSELGAERIGPDIQDDANFWKVLLTSRGMGDEWERLSQSRIIEETRGDEELVEDDAKKIHTDINKSDVDNSLVFVSEMVKHLPTDKSGVKDVFEDIFRERALKEYWSKVCTLIGRNIMEEA